MGTRDLDMSLRAWKIRIWTLLNLDPFLSVSLQFRQRRPGQGRVHVMREPQEPEGPGGGGELTETQERRQEVSSS